MIKIFAMPIYGKNPLKIFFSGLERPKTLKLGMQHWGLCLYQIYLNGDHWLNLPWPILNTKSKQLSKFKYCKTEFCKYKEQVLSAKGLMLQKWTCSPT